MRTPPFRNVAVLGLGTMGHGIAQTMAAAGCRVKAFDSSQEARNSAILRVQANLEQMAEAELIERSQIASTVERIVICDRESEAVEDAEFVTEAVAEDLEMKQHLFARLDHAAPEHAILASNTSSYPMSEVAVHMTRPERAVVTHWFNPPHIVPVVEVVPGERTSPGAVDSSCEFLESIGKTAIRLNKEIPGFLVNRVQVALFREVLDLLENEVASPEEIDRAIQGSMGMRLAALGPLAILDYAGWDISGKVYENLIPHLRSDTQLPRPAARLVAEGSYGAKSGQGVFKYPAETLPEQIAERDRTYLKLVRLLHTKPANGDGDG